MLVHKMKLLCNPNLIKQNFARLGSTLWWQLCVGGWPVLQASTRLPAWPPITVSQLFHLQVRHSTLQLNVVGGSVSDYVGI